MALHDENWQWLNFDNQEQCKWFIKYRPINFDAPILKSTGHGVAADAKNYQRQLTKNVASEELEEFIRKARGAWRKYKSNNKIKNNGFTIKQYHLPNKSIKELEQLAKYLGKTETETIISLIGGEYDSEAERKHEVKLEKYRYRELKKIYENDLKFDDLLSNTSTNKEIQEEVSKIRTNQAFDKLEIDKLSKKISELEEIISQQSDEIKSYEDRLHRRERRHILRQNK